MDVIGEALSIIGSGLSIANIIILMHLKYLQKDLIREREEYKLFKKETEQRLRRMEFFLDKRFSFSSLPEGYK